MLATGLSGAVQSLCHSFPFLDQQEKEVNDATHFLLTVVVCLTSLQYCWIMAPNSLWIVFMTIPSY